MVVQSIESMARQKGILALLFVLLVWAGTLLASCTAESAAEQADKALVKATQGIEPDIVMDEALALAMAQRFCNDMAESWLKLERLDMSGYLVDNIDTHLALRWIDFDIADRRQNKRKQLKSIDGVVLSNGKLSKISEDHASYEAFAAISYTRNDPSVNGMGIDLAIGLERIAGEWMITGLDTIGASVYRGWKEKGLTTIEEMDKAFFHSCKEYGLTIRE